MSREEASTDLLLIDAFSGDGIPVHLLTREAAQIYQQNVTTKGLILFHISNRYYDLRPVLKAMASDLKWHGAMNIPKSDDRPYNHPPQCVAMSRNVNTLRPLLDRGWVLFGSEDGLEKVAPWTDDYVNILAPLFLQFRTQYWNGAE